MLIRIWGAKLLLFSDIRKFFPTFIASDPFLCVKKQNITADDCPSEHLGHFYTRFNLIIYTCDRKKFHRKYFLARIRERV